MHSRFFAFVLLICSTSVAGVPKQAILGHRSAPLLTVDGLTFKDLDRNGKLDAYEDCGPNTRLGIAVVAVWHIADHCGQVVDYLRMAGIVPPDTQHHGLSVH